MYFPEGQNTKTHEFIILFIPNMQKSETISNEIYKLLLEMTSDTNIQNNGTESAMNIQNNLR